MIAEATIPPSDPHVSLRTECGLSAASAAGEVRLFESPHHPLDPLVSAVARREGGRWRVSWVAQGVSATAGCDVRESDASEAGAALIERLVAGALDHAPAPAPPQLFCGWDRLEAGGRVRRAPDCVPDALIGEARGAMSPRR